MWVDDNEYNPTDKCPICQDDYGKTEAIFKTRCNHLFHNNCLYDYCVKNRGNIKCPVCRSDIGYACTDVAGFKEKFLGNPDGSPLFEGNKHILDIYDAQVQNQEGGKKRRTKRIRTKRIRTKRNRTKRNRTKRLRTKRHFRVKK
jgi:hypothetical protein